MRCVCYLGTRGCPGVLAEALREHFEPLAILVPAEPRLLGPELPTTEVGEALATVGDVLAERARERAIELARSNEQQAAGVFDPAADAEDRIEARVLEGPLEERLVEAASEMGAEECFVSRDALDVLEAADVRPGAALEAEGVDLVTR